MSQLPEGESFYLVPTHDSPGGKLISAADRDREAARLVAGGWNAVEIATRLEYDSPQEATVGAKRAVAEGYIFQATRDERRQFEERGLQELEQRLWALLDQQPIMVQQGKIVFLDGKPVTDVRFPLEVIDRLLKVKQHTMKLLGLALPPPRNEMSLEDIDASIRALEERIAHSE